MNVLLAFVLWVVCGGRGICWCSLPYIDVRFVSAYWYMLCCLRVSFLPRDLSWNISVSIGVYIMSYMEFWMLMLCYSMLYMEFWMRIVSFLSCVGGIGGMVPAGLAVWDWCYWRVGLVGLHVFVWWCE
jgi:hypothetical protein